MRNVKKLTNKKIAKRLMLLAIAFALIISGVIYVLGVQGATIFPGQSSRSNSSFTGEGTAHGTQPGNVTYMDISGASVSNHWAGFYGNVSGNLTLQDANGYVFYDWEGLNTAFGEVLASNVSSVTWSTINCTNASQVSAINSFINTTGFDKDTVELTYSSNTHPSFTLAGVNIPANSCNSTNAYSGGEKNSSLFNQVILSNDQDVPIYVALINSSSTGYRGNLVDFQLLTGVRNSGTTTLYFFIELG
jgi:hypothetical protein